MKTFRISIIMLGLLTGVIFNSTNTFADKKDDQKKRQKITVESFTFDKSALRDLETKLIEDYLLTIEVAAIPYVQVYQEDGLLFIEGNEDELMGKLIDFEYLFEYDTVVYYLVREEK